MTQEKTPHEAIAGKRILLTGGTTGIGRATFLALAKQEAKLLTFGREPEPLAQVLELAGLPDECGMTADSSKPEDIERIFEAVDERLGGIDVLIACAALGAQPLHEMSDEDWRYVIDTNLVGYLACARGALKRMIAQGSGLIVLVSSISPEIMAPGESVYAATKGGINHFALTLRKEVGDKGVRVTVIEPGSVGSDMQECTDEEQREAIAHGEMLFAEEIAEAIEFVLTRSTRCDIPMLRIEPIQQKTG
ncbi:SDR family oxidoreductase [Novosphingobium sp. 9U]|uniref:SDR family oxidoreductase n=1 Tax=Novosphingobium sp. 9U TaxID=2653158 RepID=UPI0012F1F9F8|nr:SDR family oxidoreductase [Novosphingobium sp. 9U]VWX55134.1 putative 3-oxoacyl-(acyl-carrier-protein) reductase [Novosphingobium sp. 9U]